MDYESLSQIGLFATIAKLLLQGNRPNPEF